jgi:purine-cytosine permease-like protein
MRLLALIEFLRNRLRLVRSVALGLLVLLVLADWLLVDKGEAHTAFERFPGFWALFGLLACVAIIVFSKWYGHLGIMTREDYYDDPR